MVGRFGYYLMQVLLQINFKLGSTCPSNDLDFDGK